MAIWIQSLSWALIYGLGQGMLVYAALWLVLKLVPAPANARYYLSLSALTLLLVWFAFTWWQQFHTLAPSGWHLPASATTQTTIIALQPATIDYLGRLRGLIYSAQAIFPWLSGFYIVGLVFMLVRLVAGMLQLISFKRMGTSLPDDTLSELFTALTHRMGWRAPVQLLISVKAHVPMVIGFIKPVILLPAATITQLSTEQVETILLHELAHLKRYDYLINILQTIAETILFFNPFVWLISAVARREREYCCDDVVLTYQQDPIPYATALAALVDTRADYSTIVVAASGEKTYLFNRIKRIMEMKKTSFSYSRTAAAVLIIASIACTVIWMPPAFGKIKKGEENKSTDTQRPPAQNSAINVNQSQENILVYRMINDGIIDEVKGFVVEKRGNALFINGKQQADEMAKKYLSALTKENMRIEVFSFIERLNQHPDGNFIQLLFPVSNSSSCVDYKPKEGC